MAAASVGVVAPIEGSSHGKQVFTETRRGIEKVLREDPPLYERGGTAAAAQTGEEYGQTLRKGLAGDSEHIVGLPWKVGTGMVKGSRHEAFGRSIVLRCRNANERRALVDADLRDTSCERHEFDGDLVLLFVDRFDGTH